MAQQDEKTRRDDPIWQAQRLILDQLYENYPAHLSKDELTSFIRSSRIDDGDVEDGLSELLGQGLIHRQDGADYYWLARPVIAIVALEWSADSV